MIDQLMQLDMKHEADQQTYLRSLKDEELFHHVKEPWDRETIPLVTLELHRRMGADLVRHLTDSYTLGDVCLAMRAAEYAFDCFRNKGKNRFNVPLTNVRPWLFRVACYEADRLVCRRCA